MGEYFITILTFLFLLASIETCRRKFNLQNDSTRRIAHISAGLIFFTPYFLTSLQIVSLAALFTGFLITTKYFRLLSSIHNVERKTLGEIFFPAGIGLSALFFLPDHILAFQFGVLVLTFADVVANIAGGLYGKHKIQLFKNTKSIEGSLAFFLVVVSLIFFFILIGVGFSIYEVLIIAVVLTLLELFLVFGLDNLVLPAVASYLFVLFL